MSNRVNQRIYYSGRVQGVGFRYSVKQIAAGFDVVGGVRNLPDGRVELEASGDGAEVAAFLEAISHSHLATYIRQAEQTGIEPGANAVGFEIRH